MYPSFLNRRWLAVCFSTFFFALFFTGCGTAVAPQKDTFAPDKHPSMVGYLNERGLDHGSEPVVLPSEMLQSLPSDQHRDFLKHYFSLFFKKAKNPALISAMVEGSFGVTLHDATEVKALSEGDEAALTRLVDKVYSETEFVSRQGSLDYFPTIPLEKLNDIRKSMFFKSEDPNPAAARAFTGNYPEALWKEVMIRHDEDCGPPSAPEFPKAIEAYGVSTGLSPVTALAAPCYRRNSEILARALNLLANAATGEKVEFKLRWQLLTRDKFGKDLVKTVNSYETLVKALGEYYFTFELVHSRSPMDPLPLWVGKGSDKKSIRTATWVEAPLTHGKSARIPAETTTLTLMMRWGNVRLAGVEFTYDPTGSSDLSESVQWRPHLNVRAPWAHNLHEFIFKYQTGQAKPLNDYLVASAEVMKGYQTLNQHFHPEVSPFGLLPFGDASTWVLARNIERAKLPKPNGRLSGGFPSVWAKGPEFDLLSKTMGIPTVDWEKFLPPDEVLAKDPDALKYRLSLAFNPASDKRFEAFADFKEDGLKRIRE